MDYCFQYFHSYKSIPLPAAYDEDSSMSHLWSRLQLLWCSAQLCSSELTSYLSHLPHTNNNTTIQHTASLTRSWPHLPGSSTGPVLSISHPSTWRLPGWQLYSANQVRGSFCPPRWRKVPHEAQVSVNKDGPAEFCALNEISLIYEHINWKML